jgi:hypothetical protein
MGSTPAREDLLIVTILKIVKKFFIAGVEVTTTAAQLNSLAGVTPGTGAVSKALVLDASGNVVMPANGQFEFSNATPAAAGADAAGATVLTAQVNLVTGADGAKGVALPAAVDNHMIYIANTSLTANLLVYPVSGGNDNINGLAEDLAFTMGPGKGAWFTAISATQWYVPDGAGSARTTSQVDLLVQGVAAGYKVARGVAAITGSGTVVTGLATVVAVIATPQSDPDGTALAMVSATIGDQAGAPAAGSVILKAWKITAADNAALIAATAAQNINWVAIGT